MSIVLGALRAAQLIFCAIVLGLSIKLLKGQGDTRLFNKSPSQTGFSAFVGGFGLLCAAVGVVSIFVEKLRGIITWALDAIAGILLVVAGIVVAVALRNTNCGNPYDTFTNPLVNCGLEKGIKRPASACFDSERQSRCTSYKANDAFEFLAGITFFCEFGILVAQRPTFKDNLWCLMNSRIDVLSSSWILNKVCKRTLVRRGDERSDFFGLCQRGIEEDEKLIFGNINYTIVTCLYAFICVLTTIPRAFK